ncbi:MAG: MBL fold metallo-hydrolase [Nitrospirota bacterium]|nr:MBL fold metallo-hydrolase [Nitrospirota bacterium]
MQQSVTVTSQEFKKKLDAGEIRFIFDLRNREDFSGWRIEGRTEVEALNIPQEEFVGEEDSHLAKFPKDRQIVTICAHGDSSKYTAELLRAKGYDAITLQGGMDAWSDFYETHTVSDRPAIYQIYRSARGCITHVIVSEGEAVVIDAVRHTDQIIDLAVAAKAKITKVFDTHLQADHISGGREIARRTGATYHIHPVDAAGAAYSFVPLKDGERITFGKCTLDVIHSPGHTPGSTSFLLDGKVLFTGDTIMKASIGRPDLGGMADDWAKLLFETLFTRFGKLEGSIVILPTHAFSLKEQDKDGIVRMTLDEARTNSDLYQIKEFPAFLGHIKASLMENPQRYQDIRKVNLGQLDPDEAKRKELEIGKNLCGMAKD